MDKKVARIVWNTAGWQRPSGSDGKASGDTYEGDTGFGHEEWLLDGSRILDGYHYAFIDPVRKGQHAGNTYQIHFFTRNAVVREKYYLGYIDSVYCLTDEEAKGVFERYVQLGWIESMKDEIRAAGGNPAEFGHIDEQSQPINILNIRFRMEDVHFFQEPAAIADTDQNTRAEYYRLYDYKGEFELKQSVSERGDFTVSISHYEKYLTALRTKPFLLLAGISGTGKSRIVRELAYKSCPEYLRDELGTTPGNYCMIEVKPNWHDSSELMGYYSTISKQYQFTRFVKFLVKAMMFPDVPFFVCLDEMNLAPVEQYFAEFLSVLETRRIVGERIVSGVLVDGHFFEECGLTGCRNNGEVYMKLHECGCDDVDSAVAQSASLIEKGLTLPDNVFIIGTVNMDDTTHQFSRKVIDRAMTIEMNGGELAKMFGRSSDLEYSDSPWTMADNLRCHYVSADEVLEKHPRGAQTIKDELVRFLTDVNKALDNTPFGVSYRVLNEMCIYLGNLLDVHNPTTEEGLKQMMKQAEDQITLMKILPRIEGDEDMFRGKGELNKLELLMTLFDKEGDSWKKLDEMNKRLTGGGFTRFWP